MACISLFHKHLTEHTILQQFVEVKIIMEFIRTDRTHHAIRPND